jgi:hypothetical protein
MKLSRLGHWLAVATLVAACPAGAQVVYLQNDGFSGGTLSCNLSIGVDASLAAKFTAAPFQYPYTIDHVRVLGCGGGFDAYFVDIYQDDGGAANPGPLLWQSASPYVIDGSQVFNDIPIATKPNPPPAITSGSIRVVLVNFSFVAPIGFGTDTNGITAHRNYVRSAAGAWSFAEDVGISGDWILRLGIVPPPVPVELQAFTLE